jgi:hypothetical protein
LKLLFDQNLAPRLVARLADIFPASGARRNTDRCSEAYVMATRAQRRADFAVGDDAHQLARRIFAAPCAGRAFARS